MRIIASRYTKRVKQHVFRTRIRHMGILGVCRYHNFINVLKVNSKKKSNLKRLFSTAAGKVEKKHNLHTVFFNYASDLIYK